MRDSENEKGVILISSRSRVLKFMITPHKSFGTITNRAGSDVLAETKTGEQLQVEIPKDGIWFTSKARYIHPDNCWAIMAVSPKRWFAPPKDKLDLPTP